MQEVGRLQLTRRMHVRVVRLVDAWTKSVLFFIFLIVLGVVG